MPAGLQVEVARVLYFGIFRVLSQHTDVAAKGNEAKLILCLAFFEGEELFAESNGKHFYVDFKEFCHEKMSGFVYENQQSQHDGHGNNISEIWDAKNAHFLPPVLLVFLRVCPVLRLPPPSQGGRRR